ncbi:fimbria/pilus outer membrane usher protein [Xenorhabdus szentirmaii]|uniref:Outer membrane usher protein lpfC n=1 Tax=Xenorhabdus szentirmaii DSM 16338 TaxID=1427518 RepID=W1IVZ2_9GAMM|nr:fimbria/pilus outer membrane usher protein [Xenorhabdus szentirmaii]PHM32904.1 long polar fimbrial usher protein LpfC [Xenorhabdus szentirmaii DSM 16338]CDL81791.1 Outer membrane usher protein lpfC [Xenorhabdus szentirmaii DSM 16338]
MSKHIRYKSIEWVYRGRCCRFLFFAFVVAGHFFYHLTANAENKFNIHALKIGGILPEDIDLSAFNEGHQLPGKYWVDIYLNTRNTDKKNIVFILKNGRLQPEITIRQWREMGVRVDSIPSLAALPSETVITDISQYIPSASTDFDFNQQRLNISIPQADLSYQPKDYVSPELWDYGVNAFLLNYIYNGATNWSDNQKTTRNNYLNLKSGANWQAWRLRNNAIYSDQGHQWKSISTYLQRDIHSLKGQLVLGDNFTSGTLFDGIEFRGVQLASDENMLPDSQKGFAPIVRGIAQSNAQVTIKQNGYVIYQTYVPPGAFEIKDLYPTISSGDLEIVIKEADGRERKFTQPFSVEPTMLREGSLRYSLALGRYRSISRNTRKPYFSQGTLIYGLHNRLTAYGGTILSHDYYSALLGSGVDLGNLGSVSFDATYARTDLPLNQKSSGQAYRIRYAKNFSLTGTYFLLTNYRYLTEGFHDFAEANRIGYTGQLFEHSNEKSKLQLQVSQTLGDFGQLSIIASQQNHWIQKGYNRSINATYNISHQGINYGVDYSYNLRPHSAGHEQMFAFKVHIPLDRWLKKSWASYGININRNNRVVQQVSLAGTALEDNNLFYFVQQGYGNQGQGMSSNIRGEYKGSYGQIYVSYNDQFHSKQHQSRQLNYGISGSAVIHPYGVTLSQELGETAVLVRAKGAEGIKIANNAAIATDGSGHAVVPYVSHYRKNRVALEPHSFSDDIDIDVNTRSVIPTKGALVLADFQARKGNRVLMYLTHQGKPVPFGAKVTPEQLNGIDKKADAIVSNEGQVYLTALPDKGRLNAKWGSSETKTCTVNYILPPKKPQSGVYTLNLNCE